MPIANQSDQITRPPLGIAAKILRFGYPAASGRWGQKSQERDPSPCFVAGFGRDESPEPVRIYRK
jgi:hypothetical protein